jgi:hypothetical protein
VGWGANGFRSPALTAMRPQKKEAPDRAIPGLRSPAARDTHGTFFSAPESTTQRQNSGWCVTEPRLQYDDPRGSNATR